MRHNNLLILFLTIALLTSCNSVNDHERDSYTELRTEIEILEREISVNHAKADINKDKIAKYNEEIETYKDEIDILTNQNNKLQVELDKSKMEMEELFTQEDLDLIINDMKSEEERARNSSNHFRDLINKFIERKAYIISDLKVGSKIGDFVVDELNYVKIPNEKDERSYHEYSMTLKGETFIKGYIYYFLDEVILINGTSIKDNYEYLICFDDNYNLEEYETDVLSVFYEFHHIDEVNKLKITLGEKTYNSLCSGDVYYIEAKVDNVICSYKSESSGYSTAEVVDVMKIEIVDKSIVDELH